MPDPDPININDVVFNGIKAGDRRLFSGDMTDEQVRIYEEEQHQAVQNALENLGKKQEMQPVLAVLKEYKEATEHPENIERISGGSITVGVDYSIADNRIVSEVYNPTPGRLAIHVNRDELDEWIEAGTVEANLQQLLIDGAQAYNDDPNIDKALEELRPNGPRLIEDRFYDHNYDAKVWTGADLERFSKYADNMAKEAGVSDADLPNVTQDGRDPNENERER